MREEILKKHICDLYDMREGLSFKAEKIRALKTKIGVEFEGDSIKGNYTIKFIPFPRNHTILETAIIEQFIRDHELDIDNEVCTLSKTIDLLESIGKKDYCEVDLFNMDKPPVEC